MERRARLLLVEDEGRLRELVAQFLRGADFRVVEAADGPEGVARFADSGPFDLALVDIQLPGFDGVEVCRQIRRARPEQPIMICTATILDHYEAALHALGIGHVLTKPYHPEALLTHIARELAPAGPRPPAPSPAPASLPVLAIPPRIG